MHCILKCLLALADLRDYHGFEHKDLLDKTFGTAVRVMGPEVVLAAVPLSSQPTRSVNNALSYLVMFQLLNFKI